MRGGSGFRRAAAVQADPGRPSPFLDGHVPARSLAGGGVHRVGREPEFGRLPFPALAQRILVDVALVRAGHQRRTLGEARVGTRGPETPRRHRRLDLGAPGRERLDDLARYARDLEPPVGVGLLDTVAEFRQLPRQLGAVHHADELLAPVERFVGHGAPLAVPALDHVGEHGMGMELRVEVARGLVSEGGDDRLLVAGADHAPRLRVLHAGLDDVPFDPSEGALHRFVVSGDDAAIAADQGGERDRLGRGEGEVASGTVMDVALPVPASETIARSVGHLSREYVLERVRVDGTFEAERLGALAGPGAGVAVGGVVPGVVAVAFVVGHALRRRGDGADRDDHQIQSGG